ncbi:MAG: protoporphyrinogen oxidase [bacterium]
MRVVVVGGGIAGLAAAERLGRARPDDEVVVLEAADRIGGKLRVNEVAGHPVDVGAEALLVRRPEGLVLARAAGLSDEVIRPLTTAASIWTGRPHPIPGGTVLGIPGDVEAATASGLFSDATLRRLAAEREEHHPRLEQDVSVGDLVGERLGQEVVADLVDPLLGGVYAGRAGEISLQAAIPALAARLATEGGSLVAAAAALNEAGRAATPVGAPVFASLRGGLGRLPEQVATRGRFTVRTRATVRALSRRPGGGFVLAVGSRPDGETLEADALVLAVPAGKAAALLRESAPVAARELAGVRTASVAIVSLALPGDVALPAGSGLLVPAGRGLAVKGVTLTSQKWPDGPDGLSLLRASFGRVGDEAVLQRDDRDLVALAAAELEVLLGGPLRPVDAVVTRWGGGLPQYDVGHVDRVLRIRADVAAVPGLAVAGATYDGVGIPACIASAWAAAAQVGAALAGRGQ